MKNFLGVRTFAWAPPLSLCAMAASLVVYLPGGLFRFAWAKVVVVLVALGAGFLAGLPYQVGECRPGRLPQVIVVFLCTCFGILLLAALLSPNPAASLLGRWPRYEGGLVLAAYAAALVVGARILGGTESAARWQVLHRALAVVALPLALVCILESAGARPLGGVADLRPGATLGNASDQGLAGVLIAAVLGLPALQSREHALLLRVGCAAGVLIAVLSGSRAALLGLLVAITISVLGVAISRRHSKRRVVAAATASLVGLALLVLLLPGMRDRVFYAETVTGRWLLWQQTVKLALERPWLGAGPSGFVDLFPSYQTQEWATKTGGDFPTDSPHSWLLQALVAGGIPLLLLAILLAAAAVIAAVNRIRSTDGMQRATLIGALAAVGGYGVGLLTGFTSPGTTPLAALVCGGLIAKDLARPARGPHAPTPGLVPRNSTTVAAALAVAGGLVFAVPAAAAELPMAAGVSAVRQGNIPEAQQHFEAAKGLRPWDSDTAMLAAQAFAGPASEGDPVAAARAVYWARKSLARTPESIEAGLALSIGYINSGDVPAARKMLDELVARAPYTSALYVQRGIAAFGLGQLDQSIADLRTAASQSPKSPVAWQVLARVYQRTGQDGKAALAQGHADRLLNAQKPTYGPSR